MGDPPLTGLFLLLSVLLLLFLKWIFPFFFFYLKGFVLVGDNGNGRIQIFRQNGNFVRSLGSKGTGHGQFSWISGLIVTRDMEIIASDFKAHAVQVFWCVWIDWDSSSFFPAIDSRNWIRSNPSKDPLQNEAIFKNLFLLIVLLFHKILHHVLLIPILALSWKGLSNPISYFVKDKKK